MPEGELTTDPPPLFARVRVEVVEPPPEAGRKAAMSAAASKLFVHDHVGPIEAVLGSTR
jgi:hypothetical protein